VGKIRSSLTHWGWLFLVKVVCIDGRNVAHTNSGGKIQWSNLLIATEALIEAGYIAIHLFIPFWSRGQIPADLYIKLERSVIFHLSGTEEKDRDDKDMIAWSIMLNADILTNDKLKNHVENGLVQQSRLDEKQICFQIDNEKLDLIPKSSQINDFKSGLNLSKNHTDLIPESSG